MTDPYEGLATTPSSLVPAGPAATAWSRKSITRYSSGPTAKSSTSPKDAPPRDALHGQGRDTFLFLFGDLPRLQRWGRMIEIDFKGKKAVIYARVSTD